jgi:hypothetical protein
MNSYIYYQFELFSREEYYLKHRETFINAYKHNSIKFIHQLIINKISFIFLEASLLLYLLRKNKIKNLNNLLQNSMLFGSLTILNANIFLRKYDKEFPLNNKEELNQNKFTIFAKVFVNHNFCLQKDYLILLLLYNTRDLLVNINSYFYNNYQNDLKNYSIKKEEINKKEMKINIGFDIDNNNNSDNRKDKDKENKNENEKKYNSESPSYFIKKIIDDLNK